MEGAARAKVLGWESSALELAVFRLLCCRQSPVRASGGLWGGCRGGAHRRKMKHMLSEGQHGPPGTRPALQNRSGSSGSQVGLVTPEPPRCCLTDEMDPTPPVRSEYLVSGIRTPPARRNSRLATLGRIFKPWKWRKKKNEKLKQTTSGEPWERGGCHCCCAFCGRCPPAPHGTGCRGL